MKITDAKVFHDYLNGVIEGKDVKKSTKLYASAKTFGAINLDGVR